jgi:hypothetical protein
MKNLQKLVTCKHFKKPAKTDKSGKVAALVKKVMAK